MDDLTWTPSDLEIALGGDGGELRRLVDDLTPIIQARVAWCLFRWRPRGMRQAVRQEVEDLSQQTFLGLFAADAKVLRSWRPERGLPLARFVELVAENQVASTLRTAKRNPWWEEPTASAALDRPSSAADPERISESRALLAALLDRLREELSPLGFWHFELLYIREMEIEEVCRLTGSSAAAVYAWRSRLRRLARKLHRRLLSETAPRTRTSKGGLHE